jgi:phage gp36-like protein
MFITDEDYITVAGKDSLKVLQQHDVKNLQRAEQAAIDEVKMYLNSRYDTDLIFSAEGNERSALIVMATVDIALYHLVSSAPSRMGYEIREIRYKRAIELLKDTQRGNVAADLPTKIGQDGEEDIYNPVRFNPGQKNNYDW